MLMCEIFRSCFTYIQSWIGTARVKEENSSLAFLQISCWGKHFIGLDYLLCVNTQPWKPWQWRGELISSGGTEPGSVCGGVRQLLCTFLSLSLCHYAVSRPLSTLFLSPFTVYYSLLLLTLPLCLHFIMFFSFWHSVFFPSISEYIVASGCECALSTCCNLDGCSLPLSLSLSLPPCLLVLLYFCILAAAGLYFSPPNKLRIFPLCDVKCGSRWGNGHPFVYLSFCGCALGET